MDYKYLDALEDPELRRRVRETLESPTAAPGRSALMDDLNVSMDHSEDSRKRHKARLIDAEKTIVANDRERVIKSHQAQVDKYERIIEATRLALEAVSNQ